MKQELVAASPRTRISGVDGMRALAAIAVFLCHLVAYWRLQGQLPGKLTQLAALGAHGVDLFVVISGFCLALPVARRLDLHLDVRTFFIRRSTRILPPYYVALALCAALAMAPATAHKVVEEQASWADVLLHVALLQTLVPGQSGTINGSFWSIALELQLYLVFPFLVLLWRRTSMLTVVAAAAALSLLWWTSGNLDAWVFGDPHVIFDRLVQFTAGMWAAQRVARGRIPDRRRLWAGVVVGGIVAATLSSANITFGEAIFWSIPSVCGVLLAAHRFQDQLIGLPLERLGLISYSFYLLQQPVLLLTADVAHALTSSPVFLLLIGCTACFALTVVLSRAMYVAVEEPSIRWGARLTRRTPARPGHPVTSGLG